MRRCLFDSSKRHLLASGAWLRVRDEGTSVSATFKRRARDGIGGIEELEVRVNDFEVICRIFQEAGLEEVARQESKREQWVADDCQITFDEWPWIPPFVEIEGPDEKAVRTVAHAMRFSWKEASFDSVDGIYDFYYPGTRAAISSCSLTFAERPAIFAKGSRG
jgi:adenylate cyclase class 2